MSDFGLSYEQASHQAGDIFESIDDAALAWALTYFNKSDNPNDRREYGSAIYENGDGYSFTEPNIATGTSARERMRVTIPPAPSGYTAVAGIHSHPREPNYNWEVFSSRDDYGRLSGDLLWVQRNGIPLYLVTPSGKVRMAERRPNTRQSFNEKIVFSGIKW